MIPDVVYGSWHSLGRQLAGLRRSAGYTQHAFAPMTFYGRSTVANAEAGQQRVGREFWARCDGLLRADGHLLRRYDEIVAMEQGLQRVRVGRGRDTEGPGGERPGGERRGIERRG